MKPFILRGCWLVLAVSCAVDDRFADVPEDEGYTPEQGSGGAVGSGGEASGGQNEPGSGGVKTGTGGKQGETSGGRDSGGAAVGGAASGGTAAGSGGKGGGSGGKGSGGSSSGGQGSTCDELDEYQLTDGTSALIDEACNDLEVGGWFYVLADGQGEDGRVLADPTGHTLLTPDTGAASPAEPVGFTGESAGICLSGEIASAKTESGASCATDIDLCDWTDYWGGGIAVNLEDSDGVALNTVAKGAMGLRFRLSGSLGGAALRLSVYQDDEDYCVELDPALGESTIEFADLRQSCWDEGGTGGLPDLTKLGSVQWRIVSSASSAFTVDSFCVDNLYWIPVP